VLNGSGRAVIGIGDPVAMSGLPFTAHGFRLRPVDEITTALPPSACRLWSTAASATGASRPIS
jgi:hypothetical protein